MAVRCVHIDTIDSTQLLARRQIEAGIVRDQPVALIARAQTGGLGRFGRRWWSPPGGLWLTLVLPGPGPGSSPSDREALLHLRIGLSVADTCDSMLGPSCPRALLRWPNDIMIDDRKAAGILIERTARADRRFTLIGIGLNVDLQLADLAPELRERATTLRDLAGRSVAVDEVQRVLITRLEADLGWRAEQRAPGSADVLARARERLWGRGRSVRITLPGGEPTQGVVRDLADGGGLVAEIDGVRRVVRSAEIG